MTTETQVNCTTGVVTIIPFVPPIPVIPEVVTLRQAKLALLGAGYLQAVEDAISQLPSPQREAAQIEWNYASEVRRDSYLVVSIGDALGLDGAAKDALFITASTL